MTSGQGRPDIHISYRLKLVFDLSKVMWSENLIFWSDTFRSVVESTFFSHPYGGFHL